MPTPDEIVDWIRTESDAFAATIRSGALDNTVPACPAWTLRELVRHLGGVQRFWAHVVRAGGDTEPKLEEPDRDAGPPDADSLAAWMRDSSADLLQSLADTSWGAPAWTWWKEPRTVGAIARHQAQEAAVHRWDAQSAIGTPAPIAPDLATDSTDEFLDIARQFGRRAPLEFAATDTGDSFVVADGAPRVTVSATASDLILLLYRRRSLDDATIDGDRAVAETFLVPIE